MDCSTLPSANNFTLYIAALRNITAGNFTKLGQCEAEICSDVWGSGNPDVSGIGMTIGYLFQSILGFAIITLVLFIDHGTTMGEQQRRPGSQTSRIANAFLDNAIFFTSSIQIATFASAAIPDNNANQGFSSRIILIVSNLTLISPALMIATGHRAYQYNVTSSLKSNQNGYVSARNIHTGEVQQAWTRRSVTTFLLLILSFAAWLAKTNNVFNNIFQQGEIGDWPGATISIADWRAVSDTCFRDVAQLSDRENVFIAALTIGTLPLCTFTTIIFGIASALFQLKECKQESASTISTVQSRLRLLLHFNVRITPYLVFAFLSTSLLWAYFRLRSLQKAMMLAAGGNYIDGVWSFGQIVGAIVFVPVFFESLPLLAYGEEIVRVLRAVMKDMMERLRSLP